MDDAALPSARAPPAFPGAAWAPWGSVRNAPDWLIGTNRDVRMARIAYER